MTQSIYLVTVSAPQLGRRLVNGVHTVIVNADTAANAKINAALAANASLIPSTNTDDSEKDFDDTASVLFPSTYFDTAVAISSAGGVPGSGNLSANGDAYVLPEPAVPAVFVAGSSYSPVS